MSSAMREPTYWVLASLAGGRRHGYAILTEVTDMTGGAVRLSVTTLYAALERLERQGLVEADGEEVVDGRRRRYMVLTASGAAALGAEATRLARAAHRAHTRLRARQWAPASGTN